MFVQCVLERKTNKTTTTRVSYIHESFAREGIYLKIKNEGQWTNGWRVKEVGAKVETPPNSHKQIKQHKKNTGDNE